MDAMIQSYPSGSGNMTAMPRVLGIDSSLTATGLARIDIGEHDGDRWRAVIATATVSAPKPTKDKSKRAMVRRVNALLDQIEPAFEGVDAVGDRKSTRLNSSHVEISYAVFCLKKKSTRSILRPC